MRRSMTGSARSSAPKRREHYVYELFLDDKGQKISKSKGNGLTIDEWLTYADPDSLSLFMYNKPREAKKLYFDVIPRAVDDYAAFLSAYPRQAKPKDRLMNPGLAHPSGQPAAAGRGRRSPSRCCSTSWRWPMPRTSPCSGASSGAMRRASVPRRIRASIR